MKKDVLRNLGVDDRKVAARPQRRRSLGDRSRGTALGPRHPARGRVLLSVGRLESNKGFSYLVRALSRIPKDFFWVLVGEGPERASLEGEIERQGLSSHARLLGRVTRRRAPRALRAVRPLHPPDALRRKLHRHSRSDGPPKARRRDPRRRHSRQDRRRRQWTPGPSGRLGRAREGGHRSAERLGAAEVLGRERPRDGRDALLLVSAGARAGGSIRGSPPTEDMTPSERRQVKSPWDSRGIAASLRRTGVPRRRPRQPERLRERRGLHCSGPAAAGSGRGVSDPRTKREGHGSLRVLERGVEIAGGEVGGGELRSYPSLRGHVAQLGNDVGPVLPHCGEYRVDVVPIEGSRRPQLEPHVVVGIHRRFPRECSDPAIVEAHAHEHVDGIFDPARARLSPISFDWYELFQPLDGDRTARSSATREESGPDRLKAMTWGKTLRNVAMSERVESSDMP